MVSKKNCQLDMRERILEEAIRLFSENGFQGTSIQAIAEAVGIKNPSLLYHFGSKENLREAVVENLLVHWQRELPLLLSGTSDVGGFERFSAIMHAAVEFFLEDANRAKLALREMLDRPHEIGRLIKVYLGPWIMLIGDFIRMGQKSGIIRKEVVPEAYISQIIINIVGTVALRGVTATIVNTDKGQNPLGSDVDELVRVAGNMLFVDEYRVRKSQAPNPPRKE